MQVVTFVTDLIHVVTFDWVCSECFRMGPSNWEIFSLPRSVDSWVEHLLRAVQHYDEYNADLLMQTAFSGNQGLPYASCHNH